MTNSEHFLSGIESASREILSFERLISSAAASFCLIEPFNAARSDHPSVTSIIDNIRRNNMDYYQALDLSIRTAQRGYTFCGDAELLCGYLVDGNSTKEDLQAFISDMRTIVKNAHEDALQVSALFRSVRRGLLEITQRIPDEVLKLQEEKDRAVALKAKALRHSNFWKGGTATAGAGAAVVAATVALGVGFPPGLLIIPVILPIVGLIGVLAGNYELQKAAKRETQAIRCVDAMDQLKKAVTDIVTLVQHVDQYVTWWLEQDTMLKAVSEKVHQLSPTEENKLYVYGIRNNWENMKMNYMDYVAKISRLQDLYPSSNKLITCAR